ncbi:MAG: CPBP family intramembrane glutamic endopeptidase, partial [Usitatibacter sp.]
GVNQMTLPRYLQPRYVAFYIVAAYFVRLVAAVGFDAESSRPDWVEIGLLGLGGVIHLSAFLALVWLAFRPNPVPWSSFLRPYEHPTFSLFQLVALLLGSLVVTYGSLVISRYVPILLGRFPSAALLHQESFGMSFLDFLRKREAMTLIVLSCVIAPIVEETLFRGFFLNVLLRRHSVLYGIAVSSIVFGLFHPRDILGSSLTGVFLGLAYVTSGSLLFPICLHAMRNFSALVLYYYLGIGRVKDVASLNQPSQWHVELTAFVLMLPALLLAWRWAMNHLASGRNASTNGASMCP